MFFLLFPGFRKPDQSNCTLEVRKVPLELNNIAKINEHFGKFGNLTNIQVSFGYVHPLERAFPLTPKLQKSVKTSRQNYGKSS